MRAAITGGGGCDGRQVGGVKARAERSNMARANCAGLRRIANMHELPAGTVLSCPKCGQVVTLALPGDARCLRCGVPMKPAPVARPRTPHLQPSRGRSPGPPGEGFAGIGA